MDRIVSRNANGPPDPKLAIDVLLEQLRCPLLLLWGESDPWIRSATADKVEALATRLDIDVERVSIDAGHCPHDEAPELVNSELIRWLAELDERDNDFGI